MTEEEGTTFLNVDLEVISRTPLDPLVQAFGRKVDVLHVDQWGRRYGAQVEVAGSGYRGNADSLIRRLVTLVKALPRNARGFGTLRSLESSTWASRQPPSRGRLSCGLSRRLSWRSRALRVASSLLSTRRSE